MKGGKTRRVIAVLMFSAIIGAAGVFADDFAAVKQGLADKGYTAEEANEEGRRTLKIPFAKGVFNKVADVIAEITGRAQKPEQSAGAASVKDNEGFVVIVFTTTGGVASIYTDTGKTKFTIEFDEPLPPPAPNEGDFEFDADTGTITKYIGFDTNVVIPAAIKGKWVRVIAGGSFANCGLTSVTIPEGVKTIEDGNTQLNQISGIFTYEGSGAFEENKLTSLVIPGSIESIGDGAFYGNQLTSLNLGNGVRTIGAFAFDGNKLESVSIPGSVIRIESQAFKDNRLISLTISNGVSVIEGGAFYDNKLTSVVIPDSVTTIGSAWLGVGYAGAFGDNPLEAVTIGKGITSFAEDPFGNVFGYGSTLSSVTIPANITIDFSDVFGDGTFYDYLTNDRKAGVYSINSGTREKAVDSFTYIPAKYGAVIIGWEGANRVDIPASIDGLPVKVIYGSEERYSSNLIGAFSGKNLSRIRIPNTVSYIGKSAFANNTLTSVDIPISVTYIGLGAFANNTLTSVDIPASVTTIDVGAFARNQLTSVSIPDGVTYLAGFEGNKLKKVEIPASVTTIGGVAFSDNQLTSVSIPNGVTYIDGGAFFGNEKMTSVIIPDSVTRIGQDAFAGESLTRIIIGANVKLDDFDSFPLNFDSFYNDNGKKAGTYTRSGRKWTFKAR